MKKLIIKLSYVAICTFFLIACKNSGGEVENNEEQPKAVPVTDCGDLISQTLADGYIDAYINSTETVVVDRFKGVFLNADMAKCLKYIVNTANKTQGIRIYYGIKVEGTDSIFGLVVKGVDNITPTNPEGDDCPIKGVNYYWMPHAFNKSTSPKLSPCPPICDVRP